ncbi:MAG TPA: hypothetical protein VFY71_13780, partial [Planctomycetota bacterium]|nr:hypothetical protein [Planctomycetota bacterium]
MIHTENECREAKLRLKRIDRELSRLDMSMSIQGTPVATRVSILKDIRAQRVELAHEIEQYERTHAAGAPPEGGGPAAG